MAEISTMSYKVELIMRFTGTWPGTSNITLCRAFWFVRFLITLSLQYRSIVSHIRTEELVILMQSVTVTVTFSIVFCRLIIFWINEDTFVKILNAMTEDWRSSLSEKWQMETLKKKTDMSNRLATVTILTYSTTSIVFMGAVMLVVMLEPYERKKERLLFATLYPLDCDIFLVREIILFEQFFHLSVGVVAAACTTIVLVTCVLHVDGELDIIRQSLEDVPLASHFDSTIAQLRFLVKKHQHLIETSENIETLFTYIALLKFVVIAVLIGGGSFILMNNADDIVTQIIFFGYFVSLILDIFVYCYISDYLQEKSLSIAFAVYESLWYELKPNETRFLILLMLRSQKFLTITAGKFFDLSLEVFLTIIKTSVSYVSVFYALC